MIQLNHHTPKFFRGIPKVESVSTVRPPADFCCLKKAFSCIFFGINPFSRSNSQLLSIAWHTLQTRKANVVRVHLRYRGALLVHTIYMRLQNFAGKFHLHFYNIRDSVLFDSSKSKDLGSCHQSLTHGQHDIELLSNKLLPALTAVTCCCQLWQLLHFVEVTKFISWNIARIANAVQVTICLLVSTSVY